MRSNGNSKPLSEAQQLVHINTLLKWVARFAFVGVVAVITLLALILGLGVGAYKSSDMLTETGRATVGMHNETLEMRHNVEAKYRQFRKQFPDNQEAVTVNQVLETIENASKISARLKYLLQNVEPDTVGNLVTHVESITGMVDDATIAQVKGVLQHVSELLSSIKPETVEAVQSMVQNIAHLSAEADQKHVLDASQSLFQQVSAVLQRFNSGGSVALGWSKSKTEL